MLYVYIAQFRGCARGGRDCCCRKEERKRAFRTVSPLRGDDDDARNVVYEAVNQGLLRVSEKVFRVLERVSDGFVDSET